MPEYLPLLKEEIRREAILFRRYWLNSLSFAVTVYLFFLIIVLMGGVAAGAPLPPAARASALVGMLVWQFSLSALSVMGWSFYNEATAGSLEHLTTGMTCPCTMCSPSTESRRRLSRPWRSGRESGSGSAW